MRRFNYNKLNQKISTKKSQKPFFYNCLRAKTRRTTRNHSLGSSLSSFVKERVEGEREERRVQFIERESRTVAVMAEGESVKLFVGQVPKNMTESQLLAMFQEFASVDEVNIIKDKTTRASRGFVLTSHCMIC